MRVRQRAMALLVRQMLLEKLIARMCAADVGIDALQGCVDELVLVNRGLAVAMSDPAAAGLIAGRG